MEREGRIEFCEKIGSTPRSVDHFKIFWYLETQTLGRDL